MHVTRRGRGEVVLSIVDYTYGGAPERGIFVPAGFKWKVEKKLPY